MAWYDLAAHSFVFGIRGFRVWVYHRTLSSSFLGLPYRVPHINHKKELLRCLWVVSGAQGSGLGFGGSGFN